MNERGMAVKRMMDDLEVPHRVVEHEAIHTLQEGIEEGVAQRLGVPVNHLVKCLLLRDTHGRLFLVVAAGRARIDLKAVAQGVGSSRLSFASPEMMQDTLNAEPGTVSIFSLLDNPRARDVRLVVDATVPALDGDIGFHIGDNTRTMLFVASALPRVARALDASFVMVDMCAPESIG